MCKSYDAPYGEKLTCGQKAGVSSVKGPICSYLARTLAEEVNRGQRSRVIKTWMNEKCRAWLKLLGRLPSPVRAAEIIVVRFSSMDVIVRPPKL